MHAEIKGKTESVSYGSLNEFYDYICNTPINETFRWQKLSSVEGTRSFTKTESFKEANDLFKNGWSEMATKLVKKLKVIENQIQPSMKQKTIYDVAGYQCSVPRFLNGMPDSMINKKSFATKQKVITINKSVSYSAWVDAETIEEERIQALQIIKKLEAQGLRVNLNLVLGSESGGKTYMIKVRIKSANEKLNVSKLSFPLVHPSMLRRLFFRFIETYPNVTKDFVSGYGKPSDTSDIKKAFPNEYVIPAILSKKAEDINSLDDL